MEQIDVLRYAINVLDDLGITYALVGSYASMAYGEFRMTHDIDILAEISLSNVVEFGRRFPSSDWYLSESAAREAISRRRQFNVIHLPTGNKIDFILPQDNNWSHQQLTRRHSIAILPDRTVYAAHPEDIILGKLLYYSAGGSDKHLRDITGMLDISGDQIDRLRVAKWADELAVREIWDAVVARVDSGDREE